MTRCSSRGPNPNPDPNPNPNPNPNSCGRLQRENDKLKKELRAHQKGGGPTGSQPSDEMEALMQCFEKANPNPNPNPNPNSNPNCKPLQQVHGEKRRLEAQLAALKTGAHGPNSSTHQPKKVKTALQIPDNNPIFNAINAAKLYIYIAWCDGQPGGKRWGPAAP